MNMFIALSLCVFICFLIIYHWKIVRLYFYTKRMVGPNAFPIFGNALLFIGDAEQILNTIKSVSKQFKHFNTGVRFWLGNTLVVPMIRPEEAKLALGSPNSNQKAFVYDFFQPGAGEGMFACNNIPKMKMHRKIIVSTLTPNHLKSYVKVYAEQSKILCNKLSENVGGPAFDVNHYTFTARMLITGETLLGVPFKDDSSLQHFHHILETAMHISFQRAFKPWLHPNIIFKMTDMGKMHHECMLGCRTYIQEFARQKVLKYKENNNSIQEGRFKTATDLLIELSEQGQDITFEEVVDEMLTLIVGAVDAPSIAESFIMMMLGMHQDIQDQVYLELKAIFGESDRPVCVEDLTQMNLLERVIKESMRIFPAGPVVARQASDDIDMNTYTIPKDTLIAVFIFEIHRNEDVWEDPLRFDPDRFLPERFSKMHPYSFMPFNGGSRMCIGPKYAMMSMLCTISTILRRYRIFTPFTSIESVKLQAHFMLRPVDGYLIRLEAR